MNRTAKPSLASSDKPVFPAFEVATSLGLLKM
jgi:hypothetical protein